MFLLYIRCTLYKVWQWSNPELLTGWRFVWWVGVPAASWHPAMKAPVPRYIPSTGGYLSYKIIFHKQMAVITKNFYRQTAYLPKVDGCHTRINGTSTGTYCSCQINIPLTCRQISFKRTFHRQIDFIQAYLPKVHRFHSCIPSTGRQISFKHTFHKYINFIEAYLPQVDRFHSSIPSTGIQISFKHTFHRQIDFIQAYLTQVERFH